MHGTASETGHKTAQKPRLILNLNYLEIIGSWIISDRQHFPRVGVFALKGGMKGGEYLAVIFPCIVRLA